MLYMSIIDKELKKNERWRKIYNLGFNILPVLPAEKHPFVKWTHWQTNRLDPNRFEQYQKEYPNNDYWICSGSMPWSDFGVVLVDADNEAALEQVRRRCPPTDATTKTKRGYHFLYRHPRRGEPIRQKLGMRLDGIEYKIDIKGDKTGFCAPGSVGKEWVKPWSRELLLSLPVYDPLWLPYEATESNLVAAGEIQEGEDDGLPLTMAQRIELAKRSLRNEVCQSGNNPEGKFLALTNSRWHDYALTTEALTDLMRWYGNRYELQKHADGSGGFYWTEEQIRHKVGDATRSMPDNRQRGCKVNELHWYELQFEKPPETGGHNEVKVADCVVSQDLTIGEITEPTECPTNALACVLTHSDGKGGSELIETKIQPLERIGAYQFAPKTAADFATTIYKMEWLVNRMIVKGQPTILGGAKKVLKTNILIDLILSLGSGEPFLGKFPVKPTRCCLTSGESGGFTIKETALRICKAKGIRLEDTDTFWDFRLPKISKANELKLLTDGLASRRIEVAIIDPLYLCLLAGGSEKNAANIYDMGEVLLEVSDACLSVGCTPILAHHSRKNIANQFEPMELEDLAFAGIQEFARQWLLLSRRSKYNHDGYHELWLSVGGSVGHGGLWGLSIAENEVLEDFSGRTWEVEVLGYDTIKTMRAEAKEQKKEKTGQDDKDQFLSALDSFGKDAPSKSALMDRLGWGARRFGRVLDVLERLKQVECVPGETTRANGRKMACRVIKRTSYTNE